jgi:ABC-type phosphate transport system substrate-binding protein
MSSTWSRMKRTLGIVIPVSVTVLAASGAAQAQTTYAIEGSDTLTQVVEDAIAASGAPLTYNNLGSGQGEKDLAQLGCPASGITGQDFREGIAPMSRNFQQSLLTACPTWAPATNQVLGLDAAVFSSRTWSGRPKDMTVPLASLSDPTMADPANQSDLSIIFFGYNSSGSSKGTTAECAHPNRLAALDRLLGKMLGVNEIKHIYRRDDNSGTQDTIREHLQENFWCNGKSEGNVHNPANTGQNLLNEDLDPIRRDCVGADATHLATRCTYYPTAQNCNFGDPDITFNGETIHCTQGLVVALSETDPGSADITTSIANRIFADNTNGTLGMAGRASVELANQPTTGLTINTVTFTNTNVRADQYMFARRLFMQADPAGSGDPNRDTAEAVLFNYMTGPGARCNMDPIMRNRGFLSCFDDCTLPCNVATNLCCTPPSAGASIPKQSIGAETITDATSHVWSDLGDASHPCVDTNVKSVSGVACGLIEATSSGNPSGYACDLSSRCATGTSCQPYTTGGDTCQ